MDQIEFKGKRFREDIAAKADPAMGALPEPYLVLHTQRGDAVQCDFEKVPDWAMPIVAIALGLNER